MPTCTLTNDSDPLWNVSEFKLDSKGWEIAKPKANTLPRWSAKCLYLTHLTCLCSSKEPKPPAPCVFQHPPVPRTPHHTLPSHPERCHSGLCANQRVFSIPIANSFPIQPNSLILTFSMSPTFAFLFLRTNNLIVPWRSLQLVYMFLKISSSFKLALNCWTHNLL